MNLIQSLQVQIVNLNNYIVIYENSLAQNDINVLIFEFLICMLLEFLKFRESFQKIDSCLSTISIGFFNKNGFFYVFCKLTLM